MCTNKRTHNKQKAGSGIIGPYVLSLSLSRSSLVFLLSLFLFRRLLPEYEYLVINNRILISGQQKENKQYSNNTIFLLLSVFLSLSISLTHSFSFIWLFLRGPFTPTTTTTAAIPSPCTRKEGYNGYDSQHRYFYHSFGFTRSQTKTLIRLPFLAFDYSE